MTTQTFTSSTTWTCPAGVFTLTKAEAGGGNGGGAGGNTGGIDGGGGGGGEYAAEVNVAVTPGNVYTITVGAAGTAGGAGGNGGTGGNSSFPGDSVTVTAHGGTGGHAAAGGAAGTGGTGSSNTTHHDGGAGGAGSVSNPGGGGGGGGSGGSSSNGNAGTRPTGTAAGVGGAAVTGGGAGANGGTAGSAGVSASATGPGGGGGGAGSNAARAGGAGSPGFVTITYTPVVQGTAAMTGHGVMSAGQFPAPVVVNQWAGSSAQSPLFGPSLPGNASVVVPLTPAASTGTGTGTATAGNWLFCIIGWHAGAQPVTVNSGDDSHMWWRPASPSPSGKSRCTAWYQPNIIPPANVYVAPGGFVAGMAVTVVEIAGLGPWDTVTALQGGYSAASTSVPLSASLAAESFVLAVACGDLVSAGAGISAGGYTPLATATASNGTDTSSDVALAASCAILSGTATVTATAGSSTDLSAFLLAVQVSAPSPVPPGWNPGWAYVVTEFGWGAGYMTPADEITWTFVDRLLEWDEDTGIDYELGQLRSTSVQALFDNPDGALSPGLPGPYSPGVVPGTPFRIRFVPPAGTGQDRWYVWQRNIKRWPQTWSDMLRGEANTEAGDYWAVVNRGLPTSFRAEVENDAPYAWWPCDDPANVPLPSSLVNAAPGNSNPLQIVTSPSGLSVSLTGHPFTNAAVYSAAQEFAADSGWMYGDPVSAAWSQSGAGDNSHGRYLYCHDASYPPVSAGVSVEWWGNLAFLATGSGAGTGATPGQFTQPSGTLILWQIGTSTTPTVTLQVSSAGALQLNIGGSATTIWAGDARNTTWLGVTVNLTTAGWQAWVNGGVTATASGSASIPPAFTEFYCAGGTTGASPPTTGTITGICNAAVSHAVIYPQALPLSRVMAHFIAAYTAFGQLPAPSITAQFVAGNSGIGAYAPDGNKYTGIAFISPTAGGGFPSLAAEVCAAGGGYTSYPSVPESVTILPAVPSGSSAQSGFFWLTAGGPAAPGYEWYTGSGAGGELLAATGEAAYQYVNSFGAGAAPPSAASALGDTVSQRIERILAAGNVTTPARCIDPSPAPCVAAIDQGGQQCGSAVFEVTQSDGGTMFMDRVGNLCYLSKDHLAAQQVTWQLGPDIGAGQIPYLNPEQQGLDTDPQAVKNDIAVTQLSVQPDSSAGTGAASSTGSAEQVTTGLTFAPSGPARYAAVQASQQQNGDCPASFTSVLQSTASIQNQANFLFDVYGTPVQRITGLTVEAAAMAQSCPQAWLFVLSASVGDLVTAAFAPAGQPTFQGTWRISHMDPVMSYTYDGKVTAAVSIIADVVPPIPYWS